ncbi:hypothetical protein B0H67DRAFT_556594 [Lasiosphaeris hirsuta]|uniref:C2H2-type domain-containing protein n=1 Tax=Lasiosphaeris hirsuta TaxID=260670 RepID=A0AA40DLX4_9PEZI|nr:hypothetical protein B0H67DRAFT_556594 [Lasiosphaeris hirsuta]
MPNYVLLDEDGQVQTTRGAIIPSGYKKSAVPGLPWICPIRSCRKLTSTLLGLGRHSTNAHRAACLNDNLDGTLTILCTYANAQPGNGTYSGGSAKPPIVVTKGPTSITDSPMAEPSMVKSRGGQPDHGDPKRQSTHETLVLVQDSDDGSDAPEDTTDGDALRRKMPRRDAKQKTDQDVKQNTDQLPPGTRMLEMANPDRRYDQWPGLDDFEAVQDPKGALIPDGYVLDRSLPKRPFICPIRTCRRLYGFRRDINGHWRACHTGCRLNDNLDGTLTILWDGGKPATFEKISPSGWPSIIVSRTPRDSEPIHTPQRPHYPGNRTGAPVWITLKSHETDTARDLAHPRSRDGSSSPSPVPSTVGHDDGVDKVASDLPRMPEKYQPETSHGSHQWICPIRSCRLLYAKRADLAYHLNYSHRGAEVNDNGDGTYSVTRKHNVNHTGTPTSSLKLKVVSRNPPDPREPAMAEPRIPDNNHAPELRVAAKLSQDNPTPEAPDLTDMTFSGEFSEQNIQALWAHICDRLGRVLPIPTEVHLRYLLSQPQVRDLELDARRVGVKLERRHLISLVVQVIGEEHHKGCTACRRDDSPFPSCIRLSNADAFKVVHALGSAKHSCGNCLMRDIPHSCSIKKPTSLPPGISLSRRPLVAKSGKKAGNGTDDDLGRRKSSRLSVIKGAVEDEGEDGDVEEDAMPRQLRRRRRREEMEGENYMYDDEMEPKPKRRAVTMRHKVGTRDAIADSQSASATRSASQPSRRSERATNISRPERGAKGLQIEQDSLEAEEWERGEGRINGDAADGSAKNVAFSQSYLSANQSIQISDKISFSTTIVMSGTSHQFAADTAKTRLCTLGNGKLRVQVDGEPEFVIGSGGMFSISPGVACLVLNRGYADAMMQVTTLADH